MNRRPNDWESTVRCICNKAADPFQGNFDIIEGIRKREPQVPLTVLAECRSRESGNTGFLQQPVGKVVAGQTHTADVRKEIKGAERLETADTRDLIQAVRKKVPPLAKLGN